jgi:hypothetical protein
MSADTGVWTYAITEHRHLSGPGGAVDLSWLTGVGEAQVRTVTGSRLTVLVSDVSLAQYSEAALHENLERLDGLDEVAREHHYVIDAAARLFPLLPVRLASVYSGDAALCAALAEHNGQLLDALRRVGGRVEWGVKTYAATEPDPAPAPNRAERASAVQNLGYVGGNAEPGAGAGIAYLRRGHAEVAADRRSRVAAVNAAQAIHADLAAKATDTRLHPPQSAQLSGVRRPMLLNAAYLLDAQDGTSFTAAVAGEAIAHPELRIELTGPWPPYSFAGDDDDGH